MRSTDESSWRRRRAAPWPPVPYQEPASLYAERDASTEAPRITTSSAMLIAGAGSACLSELPAAMPKHRNAIAKLIQRRFAGVITGAINNQYGKLLDRRPRQSLYLEVEGTGQEGE